MTTNLQIGLAYAIGKNNKMEHNIVHLDEVLDKDIFKSYSITMHEGMNGSKVYVLYKNLGFGSFNSKTLVTVDADFSLTQVIHIIEEAISYDLKRG